MSTILHLQSIKKAATGEALASLHADTVQANTQVGRGYSYMDMLCTPSW